MTSNNGLTIVEIGGVKMELDLSTAKRVETYKVGDNVKVLIKEYSDSFKSFPGVIVGFDRFVNRPTIVVAYLKVGYGNASVEFAYINQESKDIEICHMSPAEKLLDKASALEFLDREITKAEAVLADLKGRKAYFLAHYTRTLELAEGGAHVED